MVEYVPALRRCEVRLAVSPPQEYVLPLTYLTDVFADPVSVLYGYRTRSVT